MSRILVTVHYYAPFDFTHQGASWVSPVKPTGVQWDPDATSIAGGFQNQSWDTNIQAAPDGLRVDFQKAWAGIKLRATQARPVPDAIEIKTDADVKWNIRRENRARSGGRGAVGRAASAPHLLG